MATADELAAGSSWEGHEPQVWRCHCGEPLRFSGGHYSDGSEKWVCPNGHTEGRLPRKGDSDD